MLCEKCKIREANIQYTEIVNGVQRDHHFCTKCARDMENNPYGTEGFEGEFPFAKFLSSLTVRLLMMNLSIHQSSDVKNVMKYSGYLFQII